MRLYKSVRLASVTFLWLEDLIRLKELELSDSMNSGLIDKAENSLLENFPILNGVSRNLSLKVSISSIIEMSYRKSIDYSKDDWYHLATEMENVQATTSIDEPQYSNAQKLYLDSTVWTGLENYQQQLMGPSNKRALRLSYVIKLVIFAEWIKNNK